MRRTFFSKYWMFVHQRGGSTYRQFTLSLFQCQLGFLWTSRGDFKDFWNSQCLRPVVTVCFHVLGLQNWKAKSLIPDAAHSRHQPSRESMGPAPPLDHVSPGGVLQTGRYLVSCCSPGLALDNLAIEYFCNSLARTMEDIVIFSEEGGFSQLFFSVYVMLDFYLNSDS